MVDDERSVANGQPVLAPEPRATASANEVTRKLAGEIVDAVFDMVESHDEEIVLDRIQAVHRVAGLLEKR